MAVQTFENIQIGQIPPTPTEGRVNPSETEEASQALIAHANKFGFPVAYKQEQLGQLIHNLIPSKKFENDQISGSSKVELEFHTESAFHPYKPNHVHLLCLRGDKQAATTYADLEDILQELSPKTIEALQYPWYETGIDQSFRTNGQQNKNQIITPLRKKTEWELCYDGELTHGQNPEAQEALNELRQTIRKVVKQIVLQAGQILTIDNKTTVHGRTPFQPRYDGTDRWLQRVLTIRTRPPQSHLNGNIITTEFR